MKIDHEFTVHAPIDQAWALLTDVEAIAPCMPGAQLTGIQAGTEPGAAQIYEGKVKVKIGPVVSEFKGTAVFVEKDDAEHRGVIDAKGRDTRGAGNASATITMTLIPSGTGTGTTVAIDTGLKISGKVAQFGAGMIKEVSEKLLGQFVTCLESKLAAPAEAAEAAEPEAASASGTTPEVFQAQPEPEALDLLDLAGGAAFKRLLPVAVVGAAAIVAVIIYFVRR